MGASPSQPAGAGRGWAGLGAGRRSIPVLYDPEGVSRLTRVSPRWPARSPSPAPPRTAPPGPSPTGRLLSSIRLGGLDGLARFGLRPVRLICTFDGSLYSALRTVHPR